MVDVQVFPENELTGDLPAEVELRIRRLEAAVTALQDTPLMEERIADKVIQRLKRTPIKALRESAEALMEPNPSKSGDGGDASDTGTATSFAPNDHRRGWFLFDLWAELRSIGRMYFDHRYHFSWLGRVAPTAIVVLYVLFWLFSPFGFIERIVDIALIVLLYHVLAREARLYRNAYP